MGCCFYLCVTVLFGLFTTTQKVPPGVYKESCCLQIIPHIWKRRANTDLREIAKSSIDNPRT